MKVELHLHTSRYSACAVAGPEEIIRHLITNGYEAVYITEHDACWGEWELADLAAGFPEIRIFPGIEVAMGENLSCHLLVLGTCDKIYHRLGDAREVIRLARSQGHATILAHPYRWTAAAEVLALPELPDAVELQTSNHSPAAAKAALQTAKRLGIAGVNTGDVHGKTFVNRFWIETDRPLMEADDIRDIIRSGGYSNCVGPQEEMI